MIDFIQFLFIYIFTSINFNSLQTIIDYCIIKLRG